MRMIVYEGTLAEINQLRREMSNEDQAGGASIVEKSRSDGPADGKEWVSTEVAYAALTRIPLSKEQRKVISIIYRAHPDPVLATDIQRQIGYTPSQFAGLMGAFGRRFSHTPGYRNYSWYWDQRWNPEFECNQYMMPEPVRAAVHQAKLT